MTCNNQGIMHAAYTHGGYPLCKNRTAHMSTIIEKFRAEPKPCKRCLAKVAKMDELAARKAARATQKEVGA
jgi:hypothetical protein